MNDEANRRKLSVDYVYVGRLLPLSDVPVQRINPEKLVYQTVM
jgi:hypothetical protein